MPQGDHHTTRLKWSSSRVVTGRPRPSFLAPISGLFSRGHDKRANLRGVVQRMGERQSDTFKGNGILAGFRVVSRRALPAYAGFQPPLPEPDGHLLAHPALQCQVLRMKAFSPLRATSTLVEPSTCPPSSCPGHYPRRWATTGTLSPWALLPVGDPVVVCPVRSTFRASVRPLPRLIAGCVLPEDHEVRSTPPVRQESGYQRLSRRWRYTPPGTGVQAIQPYPCVA